MPVMGRGTIEENHCHLACDGPMGQGAGWCLGPRCKRVQKEFRSVLQAGCSAHFPPHQPGCSCRSGKRNPGKAAAALPCFLCSSWAPPTKPSASFTCAQRARRRAAIPRRAPATGETPAGRSGSGRSPEQGHNAQGRRQWDLFGSPCLPSGTAGEVPAPTRPADTRCRCFPFPITICLCPAVSSPFLHVQEKEKKADILEIQTFLHLSWFWW